MVSFVQGYSWNLSIEVDERLVAIEQMVLAEKWIAKIFAPHF